MERPDIGRPALGSEIRMRLIARTQNIGEAERIARQYEMQGFKTKVMRKMQGAIVIYEVWVGKSEGLGSR